MYIGVPQAIYIVLTILSLGVDLARNGHPQEGEYSFLTSLGGVVITYILLFSGGFFTK
jgi:hypothetical protein